MAIASPPRLDTLGLAYSADYHEQASAAKIRLAYDLIPPGDPEVVKFVREVSANPKVNVVALGLGTLERGGRLTGQLCVKVYVRRKLPRDQVPDDFLVPTEYSSIPVDVEEVGLIKTRAVDYGGYDELPDPTNRFDPIQPGCSISGCECEREFTGTVGAILSDGDKKYLLSNYHVIAPYCTHSGVFQPGRSDGDPPRQVATFSRGVAPDTLRPNFVDAAIAELEIDADPAVLYVGGPTERIAATEGMWVQIFGRTSRYSRGYIGDTEAIVRVYSERLNENITYQNQIQIRTADGRDFADDGDSGALVLDARTRKAVGLFFASSELFAAANPIYKVLEDLRRALDVRDLEMLYSDR